MADDKQQVIDWKSITLKADALLKEALTFSGKEGHNPYLWIKKNLEPINARIAKKDLTVIPVLNALKVDTSTPKATSVIPSAGTLSVPPPQSK